MHAFWTKRNAVNSNGDAVSTGHSRKPYFKWLGLGSSHEPDEGPEHSMMPEAQDETELAFDEAETPTKRSGSKTEPSSSGQTLPPQQAMLEHGSHTCASQDSCSTRCSLTSAHLRAAGLHGNGTKESATTRASPSDEVESSSTGKTQQQQQRGRTKTAHVNAWANQAVSLDDVPYQGRGRTLQRSASRRDSAVVCHPVLPACANAALIDTKKVTSEQVLLPQVETFPQQSYPLQRPLGAEFERRLIAQVTSEVVEKVAVFIAQEQYKQQEEFRQAKAAITSEIKDTVDVSIEGKIHSSVEESKQVFMGSLSAQSAAVDRLRTQLESLAAVFEEGQLERKRMQTELSQLQESCEQRAKELEATVEDKLANAANVFCGGLTAVGQSAAGIVSPPVCSAERGGTVGEVTKPRRIRSRSSQGSDRCGSEAGQWTPSSPRVAAGRLHCPDGLVQSVTHSTHTQLRLGEDSSPCPGLTSRRPLLGASTAATPASPVSQVIHHEGGRVASADRNARERTPIAPRALFSHSDQQTPSASVVRTLVRTSSPTINQSPAPGATGTIPLHGLVRHISPAMQFRPLVSPMAPEAGNMSRPPSSTVLQQPQGQIEGVSRLQTRSAVAWNQSAINTPRASGPPATLTVV